MGVLPPADHRSYALSFEMLHAGLQVGDYRLVRRIGRGGFGEVWSAERGLDAARVALKILQLFENDPNGQGPSTIDRFLSEGRVLQEIRHHAIVRVVEVLDLRPGPVAHVMELLEGCSLDVLQDKIDVGTLMSVVRQIAEALNFVHGRGIIHRDVKAGNIFVCRNNDGSRTYPVKLIDFGIAKDVSRTVERTGLGVLVGTLRSVPPESIDRLNGKRVEITGAADQWGLGVTLYRVLYGKPPFDGKSMLSVFRAIQEEPVRFPDTPRPNFHLGVIEEELQDLMLKLLEKAPENRFPSMLAVADAVRELEGVLLDGATLTRRRPDLTSVSKSGIYMPEVIEIPLDDIEDIEEEAPEEAYPRYEADPAAIATELETLRHRPPPPSSAGLVAVSIPTSAIPLPPASKTVPDMPPVSDTVVDMPAPEMIEVPVQLRPPSAPPAAPIERVPTGGRQPYMRRPQDPLSPRITPAQPFPAPSRPNTPYMPRRPTPALAEPLSPPASWRAYLPMAAWLFALAGVALASFVLGHLSAS